MFIALTGTPGTGKTSVTQELETQGIPIISLNDLAVFHNFIDGTDYKRGSLILDLVKINSYLKQKSPTQTKPTIIEGHATHWLTEPEWIIILRCHPTELRKRLNTKHWKTEKINENVEAEILDIILCEATEIQPAKKLLEIDTTHKPIQQVSKIIFNLINTNFSNAKKYSIGKIDWSDEILKKHDR
jgi:adenylate kinase